MAKTYTAVPSVSTGDVYTAANYNTYTATNVSNLIKPASVTLNLTSQSIATTTKKDLSWTSADANTDGMWTSGASVTINTAGVYVVSLGLQWNNTVTTGTRYAAITKNAAVDSDTGAISGTTNSPAATFTNNISASAVVLLAPSDVLKVCVYQSSPGALAVGGTFGVVWVGSAV